MRNSSVPQLTSMPVSDSLDQECVWRELLFPVISLVIFRVLNLGKAEPDAVNSLIAVSMHPVNL